MCILTPGVPFIRNFGDQKSCTQHNFLKNFEIARQLFEPRRHLTPGKYDQMYVYLSPRIGISGLGSKFKIREIGIHHDKTTRKRANEGRGASAHGKRQVQRLRTGRRRDQRALQYRRREDWVDFTLGIGNPDPDLTHFVCFAWVHMKRFTAISKVEV